MTEIKLDLIKKQIKGETRYFVKTKDGFDGTANGYGYRSAQGLYKAYYYFKNKDRFEKEKKEIKNWLKENLDVKLAFENYFDESECLYRMKDGDETSMKDFMIGLNEELTKKLNDNKDKWKTLFNYFMGK